jgi:uncharacterized membrane protein
MMPMEKIFETIATLACGIFTGAAVYINLVEHPARMECGTRLAATEFAPSYRRASVMQASLAAIGFAAATWAWLNGSSYCWLVGGIFLGSVIPFTLIVIMPTNRKLLQPDLDKESELTLRLLTKWNRLHAVRTLLSLIAFLIFLGC